MTRAPAVDWPLVASFYVPAWPGARTLVAPWAALERAPAPAPGPTRVRWTATFGPSYFDAVRRSVTRNPYEIMVTT